MARDRESCGENARTDYGILNPVERIGEYIITDVAGRGGMATVFKVVHSTRGSVHAAKLFNVITGSNREALAKRFLAEARLTETLDHPNVIHTVEHGILDDGRPYLIMDFVGDGMTLAKRIAARPLSPEAVLRIYREIRSALAYCHSKGVVHADLKAENILLDDDGTALLADFGIARILDPETRAKVSLTTSTLPTNLGTPYTIAPECARGELATAAADVYAFGVLIFKLVTGIWYEGSQRLLGQLADLAPEWAPLLTRMLDRDPSKRPTDATRLPENPLSRIRHPSKFVWLATAIVSAAVLFAVFAVREKPDPANTPVSAAEIRGGYVPYAVLTPADTLTLTGAVHFGTVVLPDTNGYVHVRAPKGFEGSLITADHAHGDLFSQFHVDREPGMRVIIRGNQEIIIKYRE